MGLAGFLSGCSSPRSDKPLSDNTIKEDAFGTYLPKDCVKLKWVEPRHRSYYFICENADGKDILYIQHW